MITYKVTTSVRMFAPWCLHVIERHVCSNQLYSVLFCLSSSIGVEDMWQCAV